MGNAASLSAFFWVSLPYSLTMTTNEHLHTSSLQVSEAPGQFQSREPTERLLFSDSSLLLGAAPVNEWCGKKLESPCLNYLHKYKLQIHSQLPENHRMTVKGPWRSPYGVKRKLAYGKRTLFLGQLYPVPFLKFP